MPMSLAGFLMFFGPLLGMLALVALAAFLREVLGSPLRAVQAAGRRRPLTAAEARTIAAFHVRRRRFHLWAWSAVAAAGGALCLDWPLTAGALLLTPFVAALAHLRCPSCEAGPDRAGLLRRGRCRGCGAYLVG
jgi:hypothetical protein